MGTFLRQTGLHSPKSGPFPLLIFLYAGNQNLTRIAEIGPSEQVKRRNLASSCISGYICQLILGFFAVLINWKNTVLEKVLEFTDITTFGNKFVKT